MTESVFKAQEYKQCIVDLREQKQFLEEALAEYQRRESCAINMPR